MAPHLSRSSDLVDRTSVTVEPLACALLPATLTAPPDDIIPRRRRSQGPEHDRFAIDYLGGIAIFYQGASQLAGVGCAVARDRMMAEIKTSANSEANLGIIRDTRPPSVPVVQWLPRLWVEARWGPGYTERRVVEIVTSSPRPG